MLKVSVIIPTYQHAHFVAEAVESVLAQTYPNCEVIVVNDGSTDNTAEVLARFGKRITVIYQSNRGLAAARNTGLRAAQGELLAFLDADDIWMPDKLAKQVPLFERKAEVGLVCADVIFFDEKGGQPCTGFQLHPPQSGMIYSRIFVDSFIPMPTVMVRRSCLQEVGLFDEMLTSCEDQDLWLRISRKWAVDFVNEPLAKYRVSATQQSKKREHFLTGLIEAQSKAWAASPELRALDQEALDRCFFSLYLQLSKVHLRAGRPAEARSVLDHYARARGRTWGYWQIFLASWTPPRLFRLMLAARDRAYAAASGSAR